MGFLAGLAGALLALWGRIVGALLALWGLSEFIKPSLDNPESSARAGGGSPARESGIQPDVLFQLKKTG